MKTQGKKGSATQVEAQQITSYTFCEILKQVIRCLCCWSFTKKQKERGSHRDMVWPLTPQRRPDPCKAPTAEGSWGCVPWDSCGWASGLLGSYQTPRIPSGRCWWIRNEVAEKAARRGWGLHWALSHRGAFRRTQYQCRAPSKQSPQNKTPGVNSEQGHWVLIGWVTGRRPGLHLSSDQWETAPP